MSRRKTRPPPARRRRWRSPLLLLPALLLVTFFAYQPAWHGGILWDDDVHVTRPELQSAGGLVRIWSDLTATPQYYPVVHTAFWILGHIDAADTVAFHLANIVLHAISAWMVGMILRRLAVPGAWVAAVVFALHPVHVESVAWMTELKNTLSGMFYVAAFWVYLRFDATRHSRYYAGAVVLFGLALLSKTVTATLPAALLIVIWWQRGRIEWRRDVAPLVPLLVVGVGAGLFTTWVEHAIIGASGAEFQLTAFERGLVAGRAIWFYVASLVWPATLVFSYPKWFVSQDVWWQYLFPVAFTTVLFVLWRLRTWSRAPLAAALFFVVTLAPALGFVDVFPFRYSYVADHFQYLASLGIIALASAGLATLAARWTRDAARAEAIVVLTLAVPLAVLTWRLSRQYVDAETLYRTTIARNPSSWMAHDNLAVIKLAGSPADLAEAIALSRESLRLNPRDAEAHNNLGVAHQRLRRFDEALTEHMAAIALDASFVDAQYNAAIDLAAIGRLDEAVTRYRETLRLRPTHAGAHHNLGTTLGRLGRFTEAADELRAALRLEPDSAITHDALGRALVALGRRDEARAQFLEALRIRPDFAEARAALDKMR